MCDTTKKKLSKPKMRGLLYTQIQRNVSIAILLSITGGLLWKFLVAERRKKRYAEFYKNYDAEADFQRMVEAGVFDSVQFGLDEEEEEEEENGNGNGDGSVAVDEGSKRKCRKRGQS